MLLGLSSEAHVVEVFMLEHAPPPLGAVVTLVSCLAPLDWSARVPHIPPPARGQPLVAILHLWSSSPLVSSPLALRPSSLVVSPLVLPEPTAPLGSPVTLCTLLLPPVLLALGVGELAPSCSLPATLWTIPALLPTPRHFRGFLHLFLHYLIFLLVVLLQHLHLMLKTTKT